MPRVSWFGGTDRRDTISTPDLRTIIEERHTGFLNEEMPLGISTDGLEATLLSKN